MLSSIRSKRRLIFASVKFLSRIDGLEFRAINRNARSTQQIELAPQHDEGSADLTDRLDLPEVRKGLEGRCELPGQPDQFDVALALPQSSEPL
jgi:hypothetical protein